LENGKRGSMKKENRHQVMLDDKTHFVLKKTAKLTRLKMGDLIYKILIFYINSKKSAFRKLATKRLDELIEFIKRA
jgi:hypothetical protein